MSFSLEEIKAAKSDEVLFKILSSELEIRLPKSTHINCDILTDSIRNPPRGLRAMAATHRLDVSMAIDELGWHFYNFYHREYYAETLRGLFELEATEAAAILQQAWIFVEPPALGEIRATESFPKNVC